MNDIHHNRLVVELREVCDVFFFVDIDDLALDFGARPLMGCLIILDNTYRRREGPPLEDGEQFPCVYMMHTLLVQSEFPDTGR